MDSDIPTRGRPRKRLQPGKTPTHIRRCCHGLCTNTNQNRPDVEFLPFPKPCIKFRSLETDGHSVKKCPECSKCQRWLSLCKRADGRFSSINQVTPRTFICSQHFVGCNGPTATATCPDPVRANKPLEQSKTFSRKRRLSRSCSPTRPIRRRFIVRQETDSSPSNRSRVVEVLNEDFESEKCKSDNRLNYYSSASEDDRLSPLPMSETFDFNQLKRECSRLPTNIWLYETSASSVIFYRLHKFSVKICLNLSFDLQWRVYVYGKELPQDHPFYLENATYVKSCDDVTKLLTLLNSKWSVCRGNYEAEEIPMYYKCDRSDMAYHCTLSNTIRSLTCLLLTTRSGRCGSCINFKYVVGKGVKSDSDNKVINLNNAQLSSKEKAEIKIVRVKKSEKMKLQLATSNCTRVFL